MKLVVIEGAGKVKTVEKYLGKDYKVFATKGHIRDLPVRSLAVNVKKNFGQKVHGRRTQKTCGKVRRNISRDRPGSRRRSNLVAYRKRTRA